MSMYLDKWSLQDIEKGKKQGMILNLSTLICRKLKKGKTPEIIAEELDEELETVAKICTVAENYAPDYDVELIYKALQETATV